MLRLLFLLLISVNGVSFSQTNTIARKKNREISSANKLACKYISEGKLNEAEKLLKKTLPLFPCKVRLPNQFIRNIGYTQTCNLLFEINELNNNCIEMYQYFDLERKHFHFYQCGNGISLRRKEKAEKILKLAIEQKNKRVEFKIRRIIKKLD